MKRVLAILLVLCMTVGLAPMAMADGPQQPERGALVTAEEVEGYSRLDETEPAGAEQPASPLYGEDEIVTVIVQLEDPALMDSYSAGAYGMLGEDLSAGEAVSAYLNSPSALAQAQGLLSAQQSVLADIAGLDSSAASMSRAKAASSVDVVAQWTSLINGMAVRVPYGRLAEIRALDGVKRAYVQQTYARPEEPVTEAGGTAGYSYDMVGLQQVWDAGYTGKGMLVAVLDTGLDLNWQSYADPHIVSVHEAFTDASFKSADAADCLRYNSASLAAFLKANTLNAEFRGGSTELTYGENALYKNLKVPFAYDYADLDLNVVPVGSDHGTHVSGTIAGYAVDEEGAVEFSGVAPDAQILAMKVFPDDTSEGAEESTVISALEDALKLGADVINLSLGSSNGFAQDDSAQAEVYEALRSAGIILMTSAGNEAYSSYGNNYGGYNLSSDPELSMLSAPAVYDTNLAVASINNTVETRTVFTWTDSDGTEHRVAYIDPTGVAMKYQFAGGEPVKIIPAGYGTYDDYYAAGFRSYYGYGDMGVSGIALVQRGGTNASGEALTFADKLSNAASFYWSYYSSAAYTYVNDKPVKAVIIYDNVEGELITMSVENASITSAFISKADGEAIIAAINAGYEVTIAVEANDEVVSWDEGGEMSEFSSWGAGPGLELKPEITAPGGNIWSAITGGSSADGSTGSYGMMSGTSMAAPHMTGIAALVEQYVQTKGLTNKLADADLTEQLLVSTAVPQLDGNGVYYSPRYQGAGLVNAASAIGTPAYISVEGQNVGKLELKDDPGRTGSYTLSFDVKNMTDSPLTYNVQAVLLRPAAETQETRYGERTLITVSDVLIKTVDLGQITVPGMTTGSFASASFSQTVSLTAEEKAELDGLFANGTYIEGFVILTDANGVNPQIGLPFLAFYGDWTAAPIFDSASWLDEVEAEDGSFLDGECTWWPTILGYFDGYSFYNLGQNPFDSEAANTQGVYLEENLTISPTGLFKSVNDYELYQLREAKLMVVEVRDKETGELYYKDAATYQFKTYYDYTYLMGIPSSLYYFTSTDWDGTDLEGNVLPSGTECVYTIAAFGEGDYGEEVYYEEAEAYGTDFESVDLTDPSTWPTFNGHAMDITGDVISFDILVDTEAPKLVNNAVSVIEEDGRTYITGTFEDGNGSIASVEIRPQVKRTYNLSYNPYADPSYAEYGPDASNPFYCEYIYDADAHVWSFKADVTEYAHTNESYYGENNYYNYEWTGNVFIYGGDYGGNDRTYAVTVDATPGLVITNTSALLYVGSEFDLSVNNNTGSDALITRTSSDPEVATVDEFGHIVALAPGQTTITVSNGTDTVVCIVAVQERPAEVIDFDLSIDSFSGLKPGGGLIVKVTNLYPADVELTEIKWEVFEDDPDLYAGLINCAQYSSDGLSGEIYLNYSAYDPYGIGNTPIPGQSGTLVVTLNGVSREMHFDWEDLYAKSTDEDMISDLFGGEQTIYVTQGETAQLIAKYNDTSAHSVIPVELYSAVGAANYSGTNPYEEASGLVLDGEPYVGVGGVEWRGKLVALPGYELPETIQVGYYYPASYYESGYYECWWANSTYYTYYTYDPATGEIWVKNSPYGSNNVMVIRADGVESEGAPGGTLSGITYEQPDALYGPFDWAATEGYELTGELTTAEGVTVGYDTKNVAYYTPSEPGVSYITATSKDGKYSVNFAVVCEPVKAKSIGLESHDLTMEIGEIQALDVTFDPEPSLDTDKELIITSFNESVVTVNEDGSLTAVAPGVAFVKIAVKTDTTVQTYCLVTVNAPASYTVSFDSMGGSSVDSQTVAEGEAAAEPAKPTRTGYLFEGWYTDSGCSELYDFSTPVTSDITLYANWSRITIVDPTPVDPTPVDPTPVDPTPVDPTPVVPDTDRFVDVPRTHWAYDQVEYVAARGLFYGVDDTHFAPEGDMTRAMLVTVLWRLEGMPATSVPCKFTDVPDGQWYSEAVAWASANGVVKGISDELFAPDVNITREQIAAILWRLEGEPAVSGTLSAFSDGDQVSAYAEAAMIWAVQAGLFEGDGQGHLDPRATATRAQVAALISRYAGLDG